MQKKRTRRALRTHLLESLEARQLLSGSLATETILSAPNTIVLGQTITVAVSVSTTAGEPVTSGTVNLTNAGSATGLSASLNSSGVATFVFGAGNALYIGNYTLGAQFVGTDSDAASQTVANTAMTVVQPSFSSTADGLGVASVSSGSGPGAVTGQYLRVQYTGFYTSSGAEFDESAAHSPGSFGYILNDTPEQVIAGFDEGTTGIEAGETRVLYIPSALGYQDGQIRVFIIRCLSIAASSSAGAAAQLTFNSVPTSAMAGQIITPAIVVNVEDSANNLVTTDTSNISIAIANGPNGATLSGTTTTAASGGYALFSDLELSDPGTYTLSITDTTDGVPAVTSASITVAPSFATLSGGVFTVDGTSGDDVIELSSDGTNITAVLNGIASPLFALSNITAIKVNGNAGNDNITLDSSLPTTLGVSVQGGPGDDTIQGGPGNDTLGGGQGNDSLFGGPGDDSIKGGLGDDILAGAKGNDTLFGGPGNDTLRGALGDDYLNGGAGTNQLYGGQGNNTFYAVNGSADQLFAGAATNDSLFFSSADAPVIETGVIPAGNQTQVS
jgi:Ca2+-binding RTX toxin-like protein